MLHFIPLRSLSRLCIYCRTFHAAAAADSTAFSSSIKWVRDRALDHAVEKERDLKSMLNLKHLLISEPSNSLPLSIISDNKDSLRIPIRPIDFVRKYPSVFQEFLPGGIGIHPHVKLTPEILALDAEEQLLFQSESHKEDVANRLLKLLMIARINKIPLCIIDRLKWDLGLPNDYTQSVVPQFPDYFQVTSNGNELELVCWSDELAVSVMEKKSMTSFPLQYSRGFEVDKKFKKWVDDWQKLPYVSPYQNAMHLQESKSDESDKWTVGILHEVLHLLVPKKTEKDNLLFLGEYLGVRSRFKRALLQLPGIFYVSSKLRTHTVVLREAYKRDLLIGKPQHPLMSLRSKYIHLMNAVKEENKSKNVQVEGARKQKSRQNLDEGEAEESEDNETEEEEHDRLSDSELEGVTDDESDIDKTERDNVVVIGRRPTKEMKFEGQTSSSKRAQYMSVRNGRRNRNNNDDDGRVDKFSDGGAKGRGRTNRNGLMRRNYDRDGRGRGGRTRNTMFDENMDLGIDQRSDRRRDTRGTNLPRILRTDAPGARNTLRRSPEISGVARRF